MDFYSIERYFTEIKSLLLDKQFHSFLDWHKPSSWLARSLLMPHLHSDTPAELHRECNEDAHEALPGPMPNASRELSKRAHSRRIRMQIQPSLGSLSQKLNTPTHMCTHMFVRVRVCAWHQPQARRLVVHYSWADDTLSETRTGIRTWTGRESGRGTWTWTWRRRRRRI